VGEMITRRRLTTGCKIVKQIKVESKDLKRDSEELAHTSDHIKKQKNLARTEEYIEQVKQFSNEYLEEQNQDYELKSQF
jgi:hypothetical protein